MTPQKQDHILKMNLNGADFTSHVKAHDTLSDVIRNKANLTGTKIGCDMGTCGCCTVHIDGQPQLSCLTLALECQGKSVTTIEGLNQNKIHELSKVFSDKGGSQCGYCTPGFIMSSAALIKDNPQPTLDDLKEALSGNLCRCTGYVKIYEAVLQAAKELNQSDDQPSQSKEDPQLHEVS